MVMCDETIITIKRIYDDPSPLDGTRILIDRMWPRGMSKERACIDMWMKEVAPSANLRKWFDHQPERFEQFAVEYSLELQHNPRASELCNDIIQMSARRPVTLLYAAKDSQHNHAIVLQDWLHSLSRAK